MPKVAAWVAGEPALCRGINHFTSARVAVFNRRAAWSEVSGIFEQVFAATQKKFPQ
jgi:hypothetical protein